MLSHTALARRQLYYQLYVVGLYLCVVGGAATAYLAALGTTVYYYVSLFGIGLGAYGTQQPTTGIGTVPRQNIHVQRPQTKRTVIS